MKKFVFVLLLLAGCGSDTTQTTPDLGVDMPADTGTTEPDQSNQTDQGDVGEDLSQVLDMADDAEVDLPPALDVVAENYCELSANMFCDYYLRCGRIAAETMEECLELFDASCNAVYEPHYIAHEEAGLLRLSAEGLSQCETHLEQVACDQQVFDLDFGCDQVWDGLVEAGGDCAPGIGSFVCDAGTTCVLDTTFCGECKTVSETGGPCLGDTDLRCSPLDRCVDGICVARRLPGESCDDENPCRLGAWCNQGTCQGPQVVGVGEECNQVQRCAYNAQCVGGVCQAQVGLGESCEPGLCYSGHCDSVENTCQSLRSGAAPCTSSSQCVSGICDNGFCRTLPGVCFQ